MLNSGADLLLILTPSNYAPTLTLTDSRLIFLLRSPSVAILVLDILARLLQTTLARVALEPRIQ